MEQLNKIYGQPFAFEIYSGFFIEDEYSYLSKLFSQ